MQFNTRMGFTPIQTRPAPVRFQANPTQAEKLNAIDTRLTQIEKKMGTMEALLQRIDTRIGAIDEVRKHDEWKRYSDDPGPW